MLGIFGWAIMRCQMVLFAFLSSLATAALAERNNDTDIWDKRPGPVARQENVLQIANELFDVIVTWLVSNFDLPSTQERPNIEFASSGELTKMRIADRAQWQGVAQAQYVSQIEERNVVAVYDRASKTIFLANGWAGKSPADQSVLVHEIVHHFQNMAKLTFECPAAREKVAYLAQDKWLGRFDKSLEDEFGVDKFTVVVSSACM